MKNINDLAEYQAQHNSSMTPQEWLSLCPDAKTTYILPKIHELNSKIRTLEAIIKYKFNHSKHLKDSWFVEEIIKAFDVADLVELKKWQYQLQKYLPTTCPASSNRITSEQIERAKEYPILQLAEAHIPNLRRYGKSWKVVCPFHNERTPSFYIYPDSNSCHCYGCGVHMDVISLSQQLLSMTFVEAIRYLSPNL